MMSNDAPGISIIITGAEVSVVSPDMVLWASPPAQMPLGGGESWTTSPVHNSVILEKKGPGCGKRSAQAVLWMIFHLDGSIQKVWLLRFRCECKRWLSMSAEFDKPTIVWMGQGPEDSGPPTVGKAWRRL